MIRLCFFNFFQIENSKFEFRNGGVVIWLLWETYEIDDLFIPEIKARMNNEMLGNM